jgi:hypothetical protein
MTDRKLPASPIVHQCPVCQFPQTKIQRKLDGERRGATSYICARTGQCAVAINLSKLETWVAV